MNLFKERNVAKDYLVWVLKNVEKEETDTMVANGLTTKDINALISVKAKGHFFQYLNSSK
jgi:hypothetical protein